MKNFIIGVAVCILCILSYFIGTYFNRIPAGSVLIKRNFLDSLQNISSLPPTIIERIDTFWQDSIVYVEKEPPVFETKDEFYLYEDSLKTESVSVWIWDKINMYGIIVDRKWAYRLNVPITITREVKVYQPFPMPYPVDREKVERKKYYAMLGYDLKGQALTVEAGLIYKRHLFGIETGLNQFVVKSGIMF
jgi:hypothetical protein